MNIRYCRKSFYNHLDFKFTILKCLTFIILVFDIVLMANNKDTIIFMIGFICIDLIVMLYFVLRTAFVKNNIACNNLELTNYSSKIIKRHFIIMAVFILLIIVHVESIIFNIIHNMDYEVKTWIWYAILLPALYSDSVYLSGITAFGKNLYASGEYLIDYSAISHVTEICNRDTRSGNIIIMTLWNGKKNIGYDKMFLEEFIYLKNKLQHHN